MWKLHVYPRSLLFLTLPFSSTSSRSVPVATGFYKTWTVGQNSNFRKVGVVLSQFTSSSGTEGFCYITEQKWRQLNSSSQTPNLKPLHTSHTFLVQFCATARTKDAQFHFYYIKTIFYRLFFSPCANFSKYFERHIFDKMAF